MAFSIPRLKQLLPSTSNLLTNSFLRGGYRHTPASLSSAASRLFSAKAKPTLYVDEDGQVPREIQTMAAANSEDALYLRVLMPGVGKDDVDVSVEKDKVVIRGQRQKEHYEASVSGHRAHFDLPETMFNLSELEAKMSNGILKLKVPKVKNESGPPFFGFKVLRC